LTVQDFLLRFLVGQLIPPVPHFQLKGLKHLQVTIQIVSLCSSSITTDTYAIFKLVENF